MHREANCFAMDHDTGIFLLASRINHSCCPNALFKWNSNLEKVTVHAIVDIKADTEIETSYCPPHRDVSGRREKLTHYGFDCGCDACNLDTESGRAREARRQRMMEIYARLDGKNEKASTSAKVQADEEGVSTLDLHLELIKLLEDEQLFQKELGDQYRRAAECYAAQGEKVKAVDYAMRGLQNDLRCLGADSPLVQDAVDFWRSTRVI